MIPSSNLISPFSTVKAFRSGGQWRFKIVRGGDGLIFTPDGEADTFIEFKMAKDVSSGFPASVNLLGGSIGTYNGATDVFTGGLTYDASTQEWVIRELTGFFEGNGGSDRLNGFTVVVKARKEQVFSPFGLIETTGNQMPFVQFRQGSTPGTTNIPYYIRKDAALQDDSVVSYFFATTNFSSWRLDDDVWLTRGSYEIEVPRFFYNAPSFVNTPPTFSPGTRIDKIERFVRITSSLPYKSYALSRFPKFTGGSTLDAHVSHETNGVTNKNGTNYPGGVGSPISTSNTHTIVESDHGATGSNSTVHLIKMENISEFPEDDPGFPEDFFEMLFNNVSGELGSTLGRDGGITISGGDKGFEVMLAPVVE